MSADTTVSLTPPTHRPRKRIVLATTAIVCFAAGAGAGWLGTGRPTHVRVETLPQPVNVTVPAAQPPPPIVVVNPPAAAAPSPAPAAPPRPIRAATPFLDSACLASTLTESDAMTPASSCDWSDGFPAVSLDGSTIVTKVIPDDGGRGYPGLTVRFIDVKTSKTLRDVVVLDPDEYADYPETPDAAAADAARANHHAKLVTKIHRRVSQAQELIDTKGYRSMLTLESSDDTERTTADPHSTVYAQVSRHELNATVRAIDPATNTALWTRTFGRPWTAPPRVVDPDAECQDLSLAEISLAWDPETRIVLAANTWHFGGCLCGGDETHEVARL